MASRGLVWSYGRNPITRASLVLGGPVRLSGLFGCTIEYRFFPDYISVWMGGMIGNWQAEIIHGGNDSLKKSVWQERKKEGFVPLSISFLIFGKERFHSIYQGGRLVNK
jgi:hypothetical protein